MKLEAIGEFVVLKESESKVGSFVMSETHKGEVVSVGPDVEGIDVGMIIPKNFGVIKSKPGFSLPYRLIGINQGVTTASIAKNEKENQLLGVEEQRNIDLVQLGIMEMDYLEDLLT